MPTSESIGRTPSITLPASLGWFLYAGIFLLVGLNLPPEVLAPDSSRFILIVGFIATWRYGWGLIHLVRAVIFLRLRFPALREQAAALGPTGLPSQAFVVVTSYREDAGVTVRVFESLLRDSAACGVPVTVIALVSDPAERSLVEGVAWRLRLPESVTLVTLRQDGSGKRAALADGLRAVSRRLPAADAVTLLMDGDTVVPPGTLRRCLPFFRLLPRLGGLTTDARAEVTGSAWGADWYAVRHAQRHLLMSSLSLSGGLLVLTGRLSMFRTALTIRPDFIAQVEEDHLDHWRYGRFRFVTGDDKSTWFWLLRHGWRMLYVPDVAIRAQETFPAGSFLATSVTLMHRWFGNMLRNNGRALRLGPRRVGPFLWWSLLDQRLSIWTSLSGPAFALLWLLAVSAWALPIYLFWVMGTRFVQALLVGALHPGALSPRTPLLLFHTQVVGAAVKVHVGFRLNRQRWTRQHLAASPPRRQDALWDGYLTALAGAAFVLAAAMVAGVVRWPDPLTGAALAAQLRDDRLPPDQAGRLQGLVDAAAPGTVIRLAAGDFRLERPLVIRRDGVTLEGAGPGRTRLVAGFAGRGLAVIEVVGDAHPGDCRRLRVAAGESDSRVELDGPAPPAGATVMLTAGNDDAFLDMLGATGWRRAQPELRRTLAVVAAGAGRTAHLADPLGLALPAGARLCALALRRDVTLRGFAVVYDIGGAPPPDAYANLRPDHAVDGISLRGAAFPRLTDLAVIDAGRHPLNLDTVLAPVIRRVTLSGAWNKGPGGNGYLRLARTVRGRLDDVAAFGLRHVVLQWSTHHTVLRRLTGDADINFHGGFAHHNRVEDPRITPRPGHPWAAVATTPGDARWAPPDGPGNRVAGP